VGLKNYGESVRREAADKGRGVSKDPGGGIFVVDDDDGFRSFICELLESIGYATTGLSSGDAVLSAAARERPAAVLLDIRLPGLNGYEVCRELRNRYGSSVAIVFLSGERTEAFDRAAGLLIGADDYLAKPVDPGELIARITRFVDRPRSNGEGPRSNGKLEMLTQRESEVLDLLAEGLTQEEIAERLVISPKTVATHIQRILGKLEVRSRAQAVSLALRDEGDVSAHGVEEPLGVLAS
jgi:DNA-binding NarL/FixJ family response regulator